MVFVSVEVECFSATNVWLSVQFSMETLEDFAKNVMKIVHHVMESNPLALNA